MVLNLNRIEQIIKEGVMAMMKEMREDLPNNITWETAWNIFLLELHGWWPEDL